MAKPLVINWPAPVIDNICRSQNTSGAASLIINGVASDYSQTNGIAPTSVKLGGVSRTISLTSLINDLSGFNFVINGFYNGRPQTETISGPNSDTIYTTKLFNIVNSITVNGAVTGISIGTGTTGVINWVNYDYDRAYPSLTVQTKVTGTISSYDFICTLDDVQTIDSPLIFTPITDMTGASASKLDVTTISFSYYGIRINSSTDGTLTATFIQQGEI